MRLRSFSHDDILEIDRIWQEHHSDLYSLPDRKDAVIDAVVEDNGKIIGYGQVKLFAEAMLFLDKSAPLRSRILALKLLMLEALRGADQAGLHEMYAFISDPDFSLLMQKHYHFHLADKPGELLLREI